MFFSIAEPAQQNINNGRHMPGYPVVHLMVPWPVVHWLADRFPDRVGLRTPATFLRLHRPSKRRV